MGAGLATQWFYVLLDEGKGLKLRWRIRVPKGLRREFILNVVPRSLTRYPVEYLPEVKRYGGRKALKVCETIFWLSSEAAAEILGVRRWDYNSRIVLAVVLQRQLSGGLAKGLCLTRQSILIPFRDGWIRNEARTDHDRAGELARKVRTIARTAFDIDKLKAFEKRMLGRLRISSGRYLDEARKLERIRRSGPIDLPDGARNGESWSESLAGSLLHMLNNRLLLRNIDEALVAEVVLRSLARRPS
jgi:thiopeptide-type bacteriocin biosynthesis protein